MASKSGTGAAPGGSARLIGLAAASSAVLHLLALAAFGGLLEVPLESRSIAPITAVLVSLPATVPVVPTPSSSSTPERSAPRKRLPSVRPIEISDAPSHQGSLVVAGAMPRRMSDRNSEPHARPPDLPSATNVASPPPDADTEVSRERAAVPSTPSFTVPRRILIEYELKSSIADGRARYLWTADLTTRRYAIEGGMEADGFFATMFAGRFEQESTGEILAAGLRPARFSLRRGEAQAEVATFDWSARRIEHQRIRGSHIQPLTDNAQDLQSFIFQFSHEFNRPVPPERVSFAISNARKLDGYEFRVLGRETLRTPLGQVETFRLVRVTEDPGDTYEAWLSPAHQYLPIKIRFMLSGRFPVDQLATRIDIEP